MTRFIGNKYKYPIIFSDEEWRKINVLDIDPKYIISNYGRVCNSNNNIILDGHIASNGYITVQLRTIDKKRIYCHVHRLVMLVFCPIQNPDIMQVNHKNGNKQNNELSNLEWTTSKENVDHSLETGLRGVGERSSHSIFTDLQVEEVCKLMEQGYGSSYISIKVFNRNYDQQLKTLFYYIRTRSNWTHISKNYKVENFGTISP